VIIVQHQMSKFFSYIMVRTS